MGVEPPRLRRLPHPGGWAWILDRAPLDTLTVGLERFAATTGATGVLVFYGELDLPLDLLAEDEALSAIADVVHATVSRPAPAASQNPALHAMITDALDVDPTLQRTDADLAEYVRGLLHMVREYQALGR